MAFSYELHHILLFSTGEPSKVRANSHLSVIGKGEAAAIICYLFYRDKAYLGRYVTKRKTDNKWSTFGLWPTDRCELALKLADGLSGLSPRRRRLRLPCQLYLLQRQVKEAEHPLGLSTSKVKPRLVMAKYPSPKTAGPQKPRP